MQAEGGRLSPEIVTSVVGLLVDSTDRLRLRAALALHGRTPHTRNAERRWSVRRVGLEAMEALARCVTQTEFPPAVRTTLGWVRHDIHHDDPKALERWLAQTTPDNSRMSPVSWILQGMESIQSDLVPLLLESLKSAPPDVQRTLLFGLARLALF